MNPYKTLKRIVFDVIRPSTDASHGRIASKIFDGVIMSLIVFSVVSVFLCTFRIPDWLFRLLIRMEFYSLIVFTIEYALRIWTADCLYPELGPIRARIRYITSGMAIIDLISILPVFFPILPRNLVGIRMFRLVRLLRVFKLNRYSEALTAIEEVFRNKAQQMIASIFFVSIILIIASLLIYYAEHDAQPDHFNNAFSGLWWAVATLTTVGYGDIYPITTTGRILGALIAILGIGMVAVPTSILSAGFMEMIEKQSAKAEADQKTENAAETKDQERKSGSEGCPGKDEGGSFEPPQYCPHCGKKLFP